MRRFKIVACALFILSFFSFVLAAPVAVRNARGAYTTDAVGGGNGVVVRSEKRGGEGDSLLGQEKGPSSSSEFWSKPSQYQGSSSSPNYYEGGTLANLPPSPGESKPTLLSTSGGTELSWNSENDKAKLIQPGTSIEMQPLASYKKLQGSGSSTSSVFSTETQPGTSTEIQPASSSLDRSKSVSFSPLSGATSTEIQPESSSLGRPKLVSFAPLRGVSLSTGEVYREFEPPPDPGRPPLPPSPGPEREKNLLQLQIVAKQKPPMSQGKKLWKNIFNSLRKVKFWRPRTARD